MRPYEIVIIFDADTDDDGVRSILDRTQGSIEKAGGEPGRVDQWGKRRFAYELKHRWEGTYVVLQARAEPAVMAELDRSLSLTDEVLRHRIVRIPEETYGTEVKHVAPAAVPAVSRDED